MQLFYLSYIISQHYCGRRFIIIKSQLLAM